MPIAGLSEKRRLPRLGHIRLGIKVKNPTGAEYPKATDYFVCPPEVQAVYGEKPTELDVLIPIEDEEHWANQYYKAYSSSRGLICKGNGRTCMRLIDTGTGGLATHDSKGVELKEMVCQGRECPDYQAKRCQEVMNLQFLLPKVPGLGIWQIDTGSVNSIRNINDMTNMVRAMFGQVRMVPLTLTLEKIEVVNPDDHKKKKVNVLQLRIKGTLYEMARLVSNVKQADFLLPVPDAELPELEAPENGVDLIKAEKDVEELWPEDNKDKTPEKPQVKEAPVSAETMKDTSQPSIAPVAKPGGGPKKPVPKRSLEQLPNLTVLFKVCNEDFNMQPADVLKELGYSSKADVSESAWECYCKIVAVKSTPGAP